MKLARLTILATVLSFGLSAFTPAAFGCGGMGTTGCREVSSTLTWLATARALVATFDAIIP